MGNVVCIGELLIDFICQDIGQDLINGKDFLKKAETPANVCAAISKLGGEASFIGKVGEDSFGKFLNKTLEDVGVDTTGLIYDSVEKTTLAFVSLQEDGERDFIFNRGADENVHYNEIDLEKIIGANVVHFGSATALLGGDLKDTYLKLLDTCYSKENYVSFDPNYRVDLWKNREKEFIELSKFCIKYADFVKVSEEELIMISEEEDFEKGIDKLHGLGAKTIAVTLGSKGTYISNGFEKKIIGSIKIKSVDSTGAGDAFVGAFLHKVSGEVLPKLLASNFERLCEYVTFANKVGAITCTKMGAIDALPSQEDLK